MKRLDAISGVALLFFGVVLALDARNLTFWGPMGPREGFLPVILSVLVGCLGLIIAIKAQLKKNPSESMKILGPQKTRLLVYVAAFLVFGFLMEPLGYTLTMASFLVLIFKIVEKQTGRFTLITVFVCVIVSYILFVRFLGIPLPEGFLTPVAHFLLEARVGS